MERKLASVQRIDSIRPIENADNIECARILGWDVVVKRGDFQPGDLCVFFEIDSFLPMDDPRYAFLHKNAIKWNGHEGIRLKTIKLRGQLSQGLALPLNVFPELIIDITQYHPLEKAIGYGVTEFLRILKWEPVQSGAMGGVSRGTFPHWLMPKTDQERLQNIFTDIRKRVFQNNYEGYEVTEKLDGSSMTTYITEDGELHVCSRNHDLVETEANAFWQVASAIDLKTKLTEMKQLLGLDSIAVQGELMGPGVNGNHNKLTSLQFYVFDIYDITNHEYLSAAIRRWVCQTVGLMHAPVIYENIPFQFQTVDEAVRFANGQSDLDHTFKSVLREGLVFKSLIDPGVSFKVISNNYLLDVEQ